MNHAQKHALTRMVGRTVTALNPTTEKWEQGKVKGTYHRQRVDTDMDLGLIIDFGDGVNQEIPQFHINA